MQYAKYNVRTHHHIGDVCGFSYFFFMLPDVFTVMPYRIGINSIVQAQKIAYSFENECFAFLRILKK